MKAYRFTVHASTGSVDTWVEMKKNLYFTDIITCREASSQQKVEKQREKEYLREDSEYLEEPIFLRLFFFQSLNSPDPFLQNPSPEQAADNVSL